MSTTNEAALGTAPERPTFSTYQKFVVAMLAFLQFTIVLDFMIISPLGAMVMPTLDITPQQFGLIVSSYAFSAGISGILAAGFADRFDRKRFLLFFYVGFLLGTVMCGLAQDFHVLLIARVVTGLFGGVIGSVVLAIATDLFPLEMRGRVIGIIQTAFAASQIMGIPAGLYFSTWWDWHAPFLMIVAIGIVAGLIIAFVLRPVDAHLLLRAERNAFFHLLSTLTERRHLTAFCTTALLSTGGYVLMPFGSAFAVNNLGVGMAQLPTIYLATGFFMIFMGPLAGRASDRYGKYPVFLFGTVLTIIMVLYYTQLGPTPLWAVIVVNVLLFTGIFSRFVPSQALITAIPDVGRRGAFNAITASLQQISGGFSAILAGSLVADAADGRLDHFSRLGYLVTSTCLISLYLMYRIHRQVPEKPVRL